MNMSGVLCATPAQQDALISEQQLDLQQFQSEADLINIMDTGEGVTGGETNTKLVDASMLPSVLFLNSPILFNQPSSGVLNYIDLNHTTPKQTTTIIPGDINAEIYVSIVEHPMPQGTQSPADYTNLVPVQQTQVPENPSGGESLHYTDLSPAQTNQTQLTAEPTIQGRSGETINITEFSQFLSESYSIGQTSEASQTPSETFSIEHDSEATLTPASFPGYAGYATHDHQVPVSDVEIPCMEWSSDYIPTCQATTPEASTPASTSASSDVGLSEEGALTLSPTPSSPPAPRSRRQNQAGGPVRGSGRTRRNSNGPAAARSVSRKRKPREKKTKLYERHEPYDDPKQEKKRQDAINSKKNRDKKKDLMGDLKARIEEAERDRDELRKELDELRKREVNLKNQFLSLQENIGTFISCNSLSYLNCPPS